MLSLPEILEDILEVNSSNIENMKKTMMQRTIEFSRIKNESYFSYYFEDGKLLL
jgi:hypothetical protein